MTTARAHTNIALIKYWGKADQKLMLPATSSLSMTLDAFYTDTSVVFDADLAADTFILDGVAQTGAKLVPVSTFLDRVRALSGRQNYARVTSVNHVPTAAGLASSASAYAALALAASRAAGLNLDAAALSRLARRGSGSASRSILGDYVVWHRGTDDLSSFAENATVSPALDLRMIAVLVSDKEKRVSSRQGMAATVATSAYFDAWVAENELACQKMLVALEAGDFTRVGELTERSALMMHATTLAANPPFTYMLPESLALVQYAQAMRADGIPVYATMDAGPNVKLLTTAEYADEVQSRVTAKFGEQTVCAAPGPAAHILED